MSKVTVRLLALLVLFSLVLSACAPAATVTQAPAEQQPPAEDTVAPTEAVAEPTAAVEEPTAAAEEPTAAPADDEPNYLTISDSLTATWVRNFNPFSPNALSPTTRGVYEPMMIYNTLAGEIVPWLATEYTFNDDNTVLTFKLREGVLWSDGEPFTANDVVFTLNLMQNTPALAGAATAVLADYVESYQAVDDFTVEFTFKTVYTLALYDLMAQVIVPEHVWADVEDPETFTNDNPVGTGPFTEVVSFENQIYILGKNPNYWQGDTLAVDGLRFPAWPGNDQANMALVNGEVDWAGNFVPDIETTYVAKDPENFGYFFAQGDAVNLYVNLTKPPFDNVEARKALSMAIDREMVVDTAMFGYTTPLPSTGLSDGYKAWKSQDIADSDPWTNYDPEAAAAKLEELGYKLNADGVRTNPDGTPMVYRLIVVSGWTDWISTCQIIAQNMKDIGIEVNVLTPEFNAWYDEISKGEFEMAIGWSSGGPTPYNFYRGAMSKLTLQPVGESTGENWHRYVNEEADALLEQFSKSSDPAEQKDLMNQIQQVFVDNAPFLPLFPGPNWYEYNTTRFTGWPTLEDQYSSGSPYLITALIIYNRLQPVK